MGISKWQKVMIAVTAIVVGGCAQKYNAEMSKSSENMGGVTGSTQEPQLASGSAVNKSAMAQAGGGKTSSNQFKSTLSSEDGTNGIVEAKLQLISASRTDRMLIRNSDVTIEVEDALKSADKLTADVRSAKGYVGNLTESTDGLGGHMVTVQVRVPAIDFDRSISNFAKYGKILENHITSEDVTEDFVDTASSLRNLKKTEGRLLEHLNQSKKLADTLIIERELNRVRNEIERLEGHVRFVGHRVDFSTINVTLREKARAMAIVPPTSFSSGKEFSDAARSLTSFAQDLWSKTIWVGVWSLIWVPLIVIGVKTYRFGKKRLHKQFSNVA